MYSTLAEFKTYIWVSDNTQDAELTFYLNSAYELLNKLLGVDTFSEWVSTENVQFITESNYWRNISIYLRNRPVLEIQEINWEEYDWEYVVLNERKVVFKDREIIKKVNDYWLLSVKYKHWYATIPSDLKLMEIMLASWFYQQKWNEWIARYRLWDEEITFGMVNGYTTQEQYFNFKTLYNKRKSFSLPY